MFITTSIPVAVLNAALMASMPAFSPGSEWLLPMCSEPPTAADAAGADAAGADAAGAEAAGADAGAAVAADDEQAARNAETPPSAAIAAPPLSTWRRVTDWMPS